MLKQSTLAVTLVAILSLGWSAIGQARECDLGTFSTDPEDGQGTASKGSLMLHNYRILFATFPIYDPETREYKRTDSADGDLPCQALMAVGGTGSAWMSAEVPDSGDGSYYDAFTISRFEADGAGPTPAGKGTVRKYILSGADGSEVGTLKFQLQVVNGTPELLIGGNYSPLTNGLHRYPIGTHFDVRVYNTILGMRRLIVRAWAGTEQSPIYLGQPVNTGISTNARISELRQGWFTEGGFEGAGEAEIWSLPWTQSPQ